jgi:hypothetical protein
MLLASSVSGVDLLFMWWRITPQMAENLVPEEIDYSNSGPRHGRRRAPIPQFRVGRCAQPV